jgi:hypothetical protein
MRLRMTQEKGRNMYRSHQLLIKTNVVYTVASIFVLFQNRCCVDWPLIYLIRYITGCIPWKTPCSSLKVNRRFGGTCRLNLQGWRTGKQETRVKQIASRDQLEMEETCYSETSVDIQRTTRRYIPEDRTLHNHRCENLNSYMYYNASFQGLKWSGDSVAPTSKFLILTVLNKNWVPGGL